MPNQNDILKRLMARRAGTEEIPTGTVSSTTKINRQGPQIEVLNPTFEGLKEGAKSLPDTQNAIFALNYIYDKADELIPAAEDPQQSIFDGMKRSFGTSGIGRMLGAGDNGALAFQKLREPYAPLLRAQVGDKGAASEGDVQRILKGFPSNDDTKLARQTSREASNQILRNRIKLYNEMYRALKKKKAGRA